MQINIYAIKQKQGIQGKSKGETNILNKFTQMCQTGKFTQGQESRLRARSLAESSEGGSTGQNSSLPSSSTTSPSSSWSRS